MPGLSFAIAASRRFNSLSIGGAWVATASPSFESLISAPWPPTAGNCSGAKIRSISFSDRPLTSASAPDVLSSRRLSVVDRSGGTHTSRGVGARSTKVPSISSKTANSCSRRPTSPGGNPVTGCFADGLSCCTGRSLTSWFIILLHNGQRASNGFQRPALGRDSIAPGDDRGCYHQPGTKQVACEQTVARSGIDQRAKQGWASHAPDSRPYRIKQRDGERAHLERKG